MNSRKILPLHWAVFDLALHPWHESIDMLLEAADGTNISILTPVTGEKIIVDTTETKKWW